MSGMTKAERAELRAIVRQQFKVLRAELEQREIEMKSDAEGQIADRYSAEDQSWAALQHRIYELVQEANRGINDALYEAGYQTKGRTERAWIQTPAMQQPAEKRHELRHHAHVKISAQVRAARLDLDRREADLLRDLSVGALESEEARQWLAAIPSVGELVPAARLAELEASLDEEAAS